MQNNLEIMDHEIEHHPDVGAALRVRREPMRFDKTRMGEAFLQRAQDRIEPLDMADLQDESAFRR